METIKTRAVIGKDRRLRIDMEVPLLPGPVEVVVVVSPEATPSGIDPESARQQFLVAAGCGESRDPLSSRRIDEILYGRKM